MAGHTKGGNESPEVLDAVDAVVGGLEKDWQDGIGETDKIVVGGLSIDGEEECLGYCEGLSDCFGSHDSRMGYSGRVASLEN